MRTLDGSVIFHLAFLLLLMIAILFINIAFYLNKPLQKMRGWIHASSFFLLCMLIMQFMIEAILALDFEYGFMRARNVFLLLFILTSVLSLLIRFITQRHEALFTIYPPLEDLFRETDDTIVTFDTIGNAIRTHDKNKNLHFLKEPLYHIQQLIAYIPEGIFKDLDQTYTFEISDPAATFTYQAILSPILSVRPKGILGYSAMLHDITDYQKLMNALVDKNTFLKESNDTLLHEVEILEQLESEKERLNLIKKIQTQLIAGIDGTILKMDEIEKNAEKGIQFNKTEIQTLSNELNALYLNVREVVKSISPKKEESILD